MNYVALFMRAWIETLSVITPPAWRSVALFMRAWIETVVMKTIMSFHRRRPLHEGVD